MQKKIYFPNLDALRSIAALMVLLSHILFEFLEKYYSDNIWLMNTVTRFFIANGGFGVQIFFTLSGFLITYLLLSELKTNQCINLKNFYLRRILRIWPVYFIVIIFVFVIYNFTKQFFEINSHINESLLMSVLFLSNFDLIRILSDSTLYANGILALTWSVSVEEQFYLVWPLIFIGVIKNKIKHIIIFVIIIGTIFIMLNDGQQKVYYHTLSNFLFLGTGAILAYYQIHGHQRLEFLHNMSAKSWMILLSTSLIIVIFLKYKLSTYSYSFTLYFIFSALFLFLLLFMATDKKVKRPMNLSSIPYLVNIAKYTYGLYMYHRIAGFILKTLYYKFLNFEQTYYIDLLIMLFQFLLTFIMAILSYKYIEAPILRHKYKFSVFYK